VSTYGTALKCLLYVRVCMSPISVHDDYYIYIFLYNYTVVYIYISPTVAYTAIVYWNNINIKQFILNNKTDAYTHGSYRRAHAQRS